MTNNGYNEPGQPTITLRKGKTEIKVQNASTIIKKINEMYPDTNRSWPYNTNRINREISDADKIRMKNWMESAKSWFQNEMFGGTGDFEVIVTEPQPESSVKQTPPFPEDGEIFRSNPEPTVLPPRNHEPSETTFIKSTNKNAYEIRADILAMAVDWVKSHGTNKSDDEVLNIAQKFYRFVENRR